MKYLIVNADGFGLSEGCNRGIIETIENGLTTSVSANINFPSSDAVVLLQKKYPQVSIGIHLNPIVGAPVSRPDEVGSLLNPETNEFWGGPMFTRRLYTGRINLRELECELKSQMQKALDMGITITHIDSHQNRHIHPFYFGAFLKAGKKMGITKMRSYDYYLLSSNGRQAILKYYVKYPLRLLAHNVYRINMIRARRVGFQMPDRHLVFSLLEKEAKYVLDNWIVMLKNLPEGYNEFYFHPAYSDNDLSKYSSYVLERDVERNICQMPELKRIVVEKNIRLISFKELPS